MKNNQRLFRTGSERLQEIDADLKVPEPRIVEIQNVQKQCSRVLKKTAERVIYGSPIAVDEQDEPFITWDIKQKILKRDFEGEKPNLQPKAKV